MDNDIPGRYESFLDPAEKLKAIRAVAKRRTRPTIRLRVYRGDGMYYGECG